MLEIKYGTAEVIREDGIVVVKILVNKYGQVFISAHEKKSGKVLATDLEIDVITIQLIEEGLKKVAIIPDTKEELK